MPRSERTYSAPREFTTTAELHVTDSIPTPPKKTFASRKKSDGKLEFFRGRAGGSDDGRKQHKERSSSLALSRLQLDIGSWRSVGVRLNLDEENATLSVLDDDAAVLHTVPVHQLKHTSIRHAHRSLFFRPHVLAIYIPSTSQDSPIFIDFADRDILHSWLALLRAYAQPEVYGRTLAAASAGAGPSSAASALAHDGGLYRMWRQLDVVVCDGRLTCPADVLGSPGKSEQDSDLLFVELLLDGQLLARTTAQRPNSGAAGPEWQESLSLPDLPPAQRVLIRLSRTRRGMSFSLGEIAIELGSLRRGESDERRYPVLPLDDPRAGVAPIGELRLKLRMDEEIVLPQPAYSGLLETLMSRNFLEWQRDLDVRLGSTRAAALRGQLAAVAGARRLLVEHMIDGASREVDALPLSANPNVLFRGNTVFTKTMELVLARSGDTFLEAALGPVLRLMCAERVIIEVDPTRQTGPNGQPRPLDLKEIDRNAALLARWAAEVWDSIFKAMDQCPQELRRLLQHIRLLVDQRRPGDAARESAWQGVSAFVFLRFLVPAILRPHSFGLVPGLPEPLVSRSLTLVGKVIQGLANLNTTVDRAEHMRPVKDFLTAQLPNMVEFLLEVSTPQPAPSSFAPLTADAASGVAAALKHRQACLPALYRDAIPRLPHLADLPRHLALIASAVVRHAASSAAEAVSRPPNAPAPPPTPLLDSLVSRCQEVEARALRRVSKLATQGMPAPRERTPRRPSTSAGTTSRPSSAGTGAIRSRTVLSPVADPPERNELRSPITPLGDLPPQSAYLQDPRTRVLSAPSVPGRKSTRPSTAPSQSQSPRVTTPPRGILVNNNKASNAVAVTMTAQSYVPSRPSPESVTKNPPPQQQTFSPRLEMDTAVIAQQTPNTFARSTWSRTSAPTLLIPDGLTYPKAPFSQSNASMSTDSLQSSLNKEKMEGLRSPMIISPEEPRKKRRNLFKALLGGK